MAFSLQNDPYIPIGLGLVLLGIILLIWLIGKLREVKPEAPETLGLRFQDTESIPDASVEAPRDSIPQLVETRFERPPVEDNPLTATPPSAPLFPPPPNPEVVNRLDSMAQKLAEMQGALMRQTTAPAPAAPSLPPETIDKLLNMIGSVTQQVEKLQKGLKEPPSLPSDQPPTTAANPPTSSAGGPSSSSK